MRNPLLLLFAWLSAAALLHPCTVIAAGKKATKDGSIILSHTDCGPDSRIQVVPGRTFGPGEKAPVCWGLQDPSSPLGSPGEILGYIPQAAQTFTYFHSAYSHMNEHQLAIAESTLNQRPELVVAKGAGEQIMTIEQAQIFALQRCRKAKDAVRLVGQLMDTYGFLPSSGDGSESLVIGDTEEAWVFEVFGVGPNWKKASGKAGAIWAAQRIPDDEAVMIPNWSVIKGIDPKDSARFLVSKNYQQEAIDRGWFDPKAGRPFIWQEAYAPLPEEFATGRFWLFATTFAPNLKINGHAWPDRKLTSSQPFKGISPYFQTVEPLSIYPFSLKPEKLISVQDVIAFQRSTMEGTIYDMASDPAWLVPDGKGGLARSPLATPFPGKDLRAALRITLRRPVARHRGHYGMVCQLRGWLPNAIGGLYWIYLDNPAISPYVPMYAGVTDTAPSYQLYNPEAYSDASARWTIDFVDNLANLRFQDAIRDVREARDPFEKAIFERLPALEAEALELHRKNPEAAQKLLTEYCVSIQNQVPGLYLQLRDKLITKYTNNRE
ncbi:MAG: C69 family dipeptidase [Holophaga sp.]|nr:C69 family dipeptidase [Holophaga sp.]